MFIKKIDGPRAVTLPDGTIMTRADLPARDTRRWVASRKAAVVRAVRYGLITLEEAKARYGLSDEEFGSWASAVAEHGEQALKATALQRYRQSGPRTD
jgi:endonuclease/exonuclease/phosphatase family metal-dependent hydrolase